MLVKKWRFVSLVSRIDKVVHYGKYINNNNSMEEVTTKVDKDIFMTTNISTVKAVCLLLAWYGCKSCTLKKVWELEDRYLQIMALEIVPVQESLRRRNQSVNKIKG